MYVCVWGGGAVYSGNHEKGKKSSSKRGLKSDDNDDDDDSHELRSEIHAVLSIRDSSSRQVDSVVRTKYGKGR